MVLTFTSVTETQVCDHSKESHWAVVSCGTFHCAAVLTVMSADETLVCDYLKESYWAVISCGTVYYAEQGGLKF